VGRTEPGPDLGERRIGAHRPWVAVGSARDGRPSQPHLRSRYAATLSNAIAKQPAADPRSTTRYDRARGNLDRHANYIVAAFIAGAA
jgi:hypothetical protein